MILIEQDIHIGIMWVNDTYGIIPFMSDGISIEITDKQKQILKNKFPYLEHFIKSH